MGLLTEPLELLVSFGHVLAYMRLAAVGLASVYLAGVANSLAVSPPSLRVSPAKDPRISCQKQAAPRSSGRSASPRIALPRWRQVTAGDRGHGQHREAEQRHH